MTDSPVGPESKVSLRWMIASSGAALALGAAAALLYADLKGHLGRVEVSFDALLVEVRHLGDKLDKIGNGSVSEAQFRAWLSLVRANMQAVEPKLVPVVADLPMR